jgi:hypothetical protein
MTSQLKRGQQKLIVDSGGGTSGAKAGPGTTLAGCLGCGMLLIPVIFYALLISYSCSHGGVGPMSDQPYASTGHQLSPRYAAVISRQGSVVQAFIFSQEVLEIHIVDEGELPAIALLPQAPEFRAWHGTSTPRGLPLIFRGEIELVTGPVAERDSWTAQYKLRHGDVVDIHTLYDGTSLDVVRGPPVQIFVVGRVRSVATPEAFDSSFVGIKVMTLDLRADSFTERLHTHGGPLDISNESHPDRPPAEHAIP